MWWPLVGQRNRTACVHLARRLALHQHFNAVGQAADLVFLTRNNIGQVIDRSGQMGDFLFQMRQIGHEGLLSDVAPLVKGRGRNKMLG